MLYHYKSEEYIDDDGTTWLRILDELEPIPCERCGAESHPNICAGDGRYHYHGEVHTVNGKLEALCHDCAKIAEQEWSAKRGIQV